MGALVGLGVGVGLLLVWSAFHLPRSPRPARPGGTRAEQLLARAGLGDVSVTATAEALPRDDGWSRVQLG